MNILLYLYKLILCSSAIYGVSAQLTSDRECCNSVLRTPYLKIKKTIFKLIPSFKLVLAYKINF